MLFFKMWPPADNVSQPLFFIRRLLKRKIMAFIPAQEFISGETRFLAIGEGISTQGEQEVSDPIFGFWLHEPSQNPDQVCLTRSDRSKCVVRLLISSLFC